MSHLQTLSGNDTCALWSCLSTRQPCPRVVLSSRPQPHLSPRKQRCPPSQSRSPFTIESCRTHVSRRPLRPEYLCPRSPRHVIAALTSCDRLAVTNLLQERAPSRSSLSPVSVCVVRVTRRHEPPAFVEASGSSKQVLCWLCLLLLAGPTLKHLTNTTPEDPPP